MERNDQLLSAAFHLRNETLAVAGDHETLWGPESDEPTTTHISVPIERNEERIGSVQVRYQSMWESGFFNMLVDSSAGLFLFAAAACFTLFTLFLKRALSELNPSKAVPDRVRAAFDVLSEGVLILDADGHIMLANKAMTQNLQIAEPQLIGKKMGSLPWADSDAQGAEQPWREALTRNERVTGVQMEINRSSGRLMTFMVNAAPIRDADRSVRGALVTFDDMSAVERKNQELNQMLGQLEQSQKKISRKNKELETLARIDPLTGCHNRRALFEWSDKAIKDALANNTPLTCFMIDIDHFKNINDRYGHAVGDQVIKSVGEVLMSNSRADDIVGRYGGEEFCVISPALSPVTEQEVAERMRRAISVIGSNPNAQFPLMRITASIGYATCQPDTETTIELVNMADSALYVAKESGRNRVSRFDPATSEIEILPAAAPDGSNVTYLEIPCTDATQEDEIRESDAEEVAQLNQKVRELEDLALKRADEIWHQSLHDSVTGLPNRVLLLDRATQDIKRIPRHGNVVAALSIEINTFQRISDTLGHEAADALVREVTKRLNTVVRTNDTVGVMAAPNGSTLSRITSTEFVILLSDLFNTDMVAQIVRRTQRALSEPFQLRGNELLFSGNLGISLYPQDAADAQSLLKNAAAARAHARIQGRRLNVSYFSEEMQESSTKELRMETLLHKAASSDELWLAYQPKVEIATNTITGVETLLRWNNPVLGKISPLEFIPIAERSGLIHELSSWVLGTVCEQLNAWKPIGIDHMRVALNLSPLELRDPKLAERFLQVLTEHGVSPELLEVEITETGVIENMNTAVRTLQVLKNSGVRLSIDDFGTGYSSFSHLTSLPLDVLKIDGCFIREIEASSSNRAIVEAIIAMANTAKLRVLAEGVETEEELATLRELGCDEIQGYLYSEPVPAAELTKLLIADMENSRQPEPHRRLSLNKWLRRSG